MLAAVKLYFSDLLGSSKKKEKPSGKKKPPAYKRNKRLRKKKPGVCSGIWDFVAGRIGWKGIGLALWLLLSIVTGIASFAYYNSFIDPLPITGFEVEEPNWDQPPFEKNEMLHGAKRIQAVQKLWPGAVESDKRDNLYVATHNGIIVKIQRSERGIMGEGTLEIIRQGPVENVTLPDELIGSYHGRPVALRYAEGTGLLFVLDSIFGLYAVSTLSKRSVPLLPISIDGKGLLAPTSFAMNEKTTDIYITDFSRKWNDYYFMNQILEGNCTGRLLRYDFGTGDLETMIDNLCAPVGVETTLNSSMLLITEAQKPRIRVVQLNTTSSIKYTSLPGFPGKPRLNPRGGVWIPMTLVNKGFFEMVNPRPWLRRLLGGLLPQQYLKDLATHRHTIIAEVSPVGEVVDSIQDPGERKVYHVAEIKEGRRGQLIIASPLIEHLTKLVSEENKEETKQPIVPEEQEEDGLAEVIREQQEEHERLSTHVYNPEPDGDVAMELIGEQQQSFASTPKEIRTGWFDKKVSPAKDEETTERVQKKEL